MINKENKMIRRITGTVFLFLYCLFDVTVEAGEQVRYILAMLYARFVVSLKFPPIYIDDEGEVWVLDKDEAGGHPVVYKELFEGVFDGRVRIMDAVRMYIAANPNGHVEIYDAWRRRDG